MHTIILPEGQPERDYAGVSVAGFFRSDHGGRSWRDIGGVPSPFGFPVAAAPGVGPATCRVWVIPENEETMAVATGHGTTCAQAPPA